MAKRKDPAAVALGRRGGKNSRTNLTPEQRTELARQAARARWEPPFQRRVKVRRIQFENWERDTPPFKTFWGHDGYIVGFRYRRALATAWHITTVQQVTIHDFFVIDGRFHFIHETRATFAPPFSMMFLAEEAEANPTTAERAAVSEAIRRWEDAVDKKDAASTEILISKTLAGQADEKEK